ncbi:MAG: type II toxin-antitoxin system prevent-host-death family antitoxin [Dechloromonas sp.]|jgi:antitoxin CcdA|nr:type II toxin-antitoxin system prevent-host-death family antitoxin [Dechloromonas sp.]
MRTVPASEMKNRLGAYIEAAQAEPVVVERSGRPSVVMLSIAEYERLKAVRKPVEGDREAGYRAMTADRAGEFEVQERGSQPLLSARLLREAQELHLDPVSIAERALVSEIRMQRAKQWLAENRQAMADFNAHVERDGVFSDGLRSF